MNLGIDVFGFDKAGEASSVKSFILFSFDVNGPHECIVRIPGYLLAANYVENSP